MDIKIVVENKVQRFYSEESRKSFIEGNLNSSFLLYDLESEWKECDVINCHFIFNSNQTIINKLDLETNKVVIPDSLQGLVSFGLIGYVGGEKRLATNLITVKIYSSALDAESDTSIPPDIFEQYLQELVEVKEQSINSAKESKRYAVGLEEEPETLTDNSKYYYEGSKENANKTNEDRIQIEELHSKVIESEKNVQQIKTEVEGFKNSASESAQNASESERNAKQSELNASTSEQNAKQSELNAGLSEELASQSASSAYQSKISAGQANSEAQQALEDSVLLLNTAKQEIQLEGNKQLTAISDEGTKQKSEITSLGEQKLNDITTLSQNKVNEINQAGTDNKNSINTISEQKIQDITDKGTEQVGLVTQEGNTQIQRVQEASQEIQDSAEQINQNANDIVELYKETDDLYNIKAPIIYKTSSGTEIVVKDSTKAKFKEFGLTGNTEQLETTGTNLLYIPDNNITQNGINIIIKSGIVFIKGIPENKTGFTPIVIGSINLKTGEYVSSTESKIKGIGISFDSFNALNITMIQVDNFSKGKATEDITSNIIINISNEEASYNVVQYFMISKGTEKLPYEPYSGGFPSPSPDWKQDIQNSGKEVNGQYEVGVSVGGGNLFDIFKITDTFNGMYGIKNNFDGSIKITLPDTTGSQRTNEKLKELIVNAKVGQEMTINADSTGTVKYIYLSKSKYTWNFGYSKVITEDDLESYIYFYASAAGTESIIKNIMINKGKTALPYEPYQTPQSITLHSPRPLTKWDRLVKKDGAWNWEFNSNTEVFDGSEDEGWGKYVDKEKTYGFLITIDNMNIANRDGFCDTFKSVLVGISGKDENVCMFGTEVRNTFYLLIEKENLIDSSVESFKTFLQSNHITVQYQTATPEYIPLSEEDAQALDSLTSYYPTTVITTDTDPQATISIEYGCDTKTYIDNKISEAITQAITIAQA